MASFRISTDGTALELDFTVTHTQRTSTLRISRTGDGIFTWDGNFTIKNGNAYINLLESITGILMPVCVPHVDADEIEYLSAFIQAPSVSFNSPFLTTSIFCSPP
jgi:hypothetical protein